MKTNNLFIFVFLLLFTACTNQESSEKQSDTSVTELEGTD